MSSLMQTKRCGALFILSIVAIILAIIQTGTNCLLFTFKNNWEATLLGIKKPVINLILLMGPSILYRLGHASLVWTSAADKNIPGIMMKGATTEINNRLKITFYYKKHYNEDSGIKNPSRIEFSGYDPYSIVYSYKENLILDIYLQEENYVDQFANEVQLSSGIGCRYYFPGYTYSFPALKASYFRFTMREYIQGETVTQTFSEIHTSDNNKVLRSKVNLFVVATETIYDYQLGISFLCRQEEGCSIVPGDLNSPGISSNGYFSLEILLMVDEFDSGFLSLGKSNLVSG